MNSYCLNNEEYWELINHYLGRGQILDSEFLEKIERATTYWDLNIIGSNCLLSIILEKIMKKEKVPFEDIEYIYSLTGKFFFTIDELELDLIDDLFRNNMPEKRNEVLNELIEAKINNDFTKVKIMENNLQQTFEKDLINVLAKFYARQN